MAAVSSPGNRQIHRSRSRVVCQRCHARKVKCDLILHLRDGGICTNCEKRAEICRKREQPKPSKPQRHRPSQVPVTSGLSSQDSIGTTSPSPSLIQDGEVSRFPEQIPGSALPVHSSPATSDNQGYIGEFSVLSTQGPLSCETPAVVGVLSKCIEAQIQTSTGADQLPPKSLTEALSSLYFKYLYHRIPVVDHQDVASVCSSTLLQQSLCLAGSVLRHPKSTKSLVESERFYARAKALFYSNHEHDPLTILKSVCLLTLWTVTPPAVVTIDSGWSWLGLAIRFAFQIGLHKESTYSQRSSPGCARRIAWFLYAQDKLHTICFGRPQMIQLQDFDLHPPSVTDFENPEDGQALQFVLYTKLMTILAQMLPLQQRDPTATSEKALAILSELKDWVGNMTLHLHIFDNSGILIYDRALYEILTWYFTCVISFFHVHGRFFHPSVISTITLVASSCIIRLYQEMDYRDDINYLMPINNWSMMVASLPQLSSLRHENNTVTIAEHDTGIDPLSLEELDILLEIMAERTIKFPGAGAVLEKIRRFRTEIISHGASSNALFGLHEPSKYPWSSNERTYATIPRIHELFPFQKEISPRMDLLYTMETDEFPSGLFENFTDWSIENFFNLDDFNPCP
ncbi:hypothetical protein N7509_002282 [Penicillium cosmopolitanum]|uniref:Zn(2)-C6 fungal-type domain-containing protein n=1 Tax=Penicillium cosmopolitanum TaxID=1131564 RepID=A0A9W9W8S3_9EURO|nr:uncharacterized protein N7509_002282 [Penicillium cosmopolitanum]KAJ5408399.1 hypothetical protein N7509_002282 [Penicillium cosmopolitanum]